MLLGLIWLREAEGNNADNVRSTVGVLFFLLINQGFSGVFQIIFTFPEERGIITKERASRTYRVSAYFITKSMVELPRTFTANILFLVILYFMVGLRNTAEAFFWLLLIILLSSLVAESLAYMGGLDGGEAERVQLMALLTFTIPN